MMRGPFFCSLAFMALLVPVLAGCDLPSGGPGVKELTAQPQRQDSRGLFSGLVMQDITLREATIMAGQMREAEKLRVRQAIWAIDAGHSTRDPVIHVGDDLSVSILSFAGGGDTPAIMKLGHFPVLRDGMVTLPYVGAVRVVSLTYASIQQKLSRLYAAQRVFSHPSVIVQEEAPDGRWEADSVLVLGEVKTPGEVRWQPGGLMLAHVLAEAMGGGPPAPAGGPSDGQPVSVRPETVVSVVRHGQVVGALPLDDGLVNDIHLAPHDRVIVKKEASIRIPVLGGGASRPGIYSFGTCPTLADILAISGGLQRDAASSRAIFVLRRDHDTPHLLKIRFDRTYGLFVAQSFLLEDGDVVYVAESSWVPYFKVFSLMLQAGVLASIAR